MDSEQVSFNIRHNLPSIQPSHSHTLSLDTCTGPKVTVQPRAHHGGAQEAGGPPPARGVVERVFTLQLHLVKQTQRRAEVLAHVGQRRPSAAASDEIHTLGHLST